MRINQFVAHATGLSRRAADSAIEQGTVEINGRRAALGDRVEANDSVTLNGEVVSIPAHQTIMLHKPAGYVTSREQQGTDPTIYELLPEQLHRLKPVGRLDKDSSGLLILTSDGELAHRLQHPSSGKWKQYVIKTKPELTSDQLQNLNDGVNLDDGLSKMDIKPGKTGFDVRLQEGRNRQIRRSVEAVGAEVIDLHRTSFGDFELGELPPGEYTEINVS